MSASIMDQVAEAKKLVPPISPKDVMSMMDREDVLVVDVRDAPEVAASGKALMDLGYKNVRNMGAFKDWVEAGGTVDKG